MATSLSIQVLNFMECFENSIICHTAYFVILFLYLLLVKRSQNLIFKVLKYEN